MAERRERGNDERRNETNGINGQVIFGGGEGVHHGKEEVVSRAFSIDALQSFAFRACHGTMSFISKRPKSYLTQRHTTHTKILSRS
jgi:hypothetical protein